VRKICYFYINSSFSNVVIGCISITHNDNSMFYIKLNAYMQPLNCTLSQKKTWTFYNWLNIIKKSPVWSGGAQYSNLMVTQCRLLINFFSETNKSWMEWNTFFNQQLAQWTMTIISFSVLNFGVTIYVFLSMSFGSIIYH
jgi:hypothetical protein